MIEPRRLGPLLGDLKTVSKDLAKRYPAAFSRQGLRSGIEYFNARPPKELSAAASHPAFTLWLHKAKTLLQNSPKRIDDVTALLSRFQGLAASTSIMSGQNLEIEAALDERGHFHFHGMRTYLDMGAASAGRPVVLHFDSSGLRASLSRRQPVEINRGLLLEGSPLSRTVGGNGVGINLRGIVVRWLRAVIPSMEVNDCDPFILESFQQRTGPYDHSVAQYGTKEMNRFITVLRDALNQMGSADPCLKSELADGLRVIVPLNRTDAKVHVSSTFSHLPGMLGLCHDEDPLLQGETLVHEFSHNQLYEKMESGPFLEGDGEAMYYSPWRVDPRPLTGILLGAHAFLNVAHYIIRVAEAMNYPGEKLGPVQEDAALRCFQCDLALRVLSANGRITARGQALIKSLRESLRALYQKVMSFPEEARDSARAAVDRHKDRYWASRGGYHRSVFREAAL